MSNIGSQVLITISLGGHGLQIPRQSSSFVSRCRNRHQPNILYWRWKNSLLQILGILSNHHFYTLWLKRVELWDGEPTQPQDQMEQQNLWATTWSIIENENHWYWTSDRGVFGEIRPTQWQEDPKLQSHSECRVHEQNWHQRLELSFTAKLSSKTYRDIRWLAVQLNSC